MFSKYPLDDIFGGTAVKLSKFFYTLGVLLLHSVNPPNFKSKGSILSEL